eukprot:8489591-Pyramimonas_sp.AAC.1
MKANLNKKTEEGSTSTPTCSSTTSSPQKPRSRHMDPVTHTQARTSSSALTTSTAKYMEVPDAFDTHQEDEGHYPIIVDLTN